MKKHLIIVGLLFVDLSCVNETKAPTSISITDIRSNVYTDILTALVENHFYNLYLGTDFEELEQKFGYERDKPTYKDEVEKLRLAVHADTLRQRAICIGREFSFVQLSLLSNEHFNDLINDQGDLRNIIKGVSTDYNAVYESLITPQHLSPDRFQPSSFKVNNKKCEIGMISFSKAFFNTKGNQALLYYEFVCGEKCGKGEILRIENKDGIWVIQEKERMWIL